MYRDKNKVFISKEVFSINSVIMTTKNDFDTVHFHCCMCSLLCSLDLTFYIYNVKFYITVLHLQAIFSWQDSGTRDNDISIGFTFIPSTFQLIGSGLGMTGKAK